MSDPTRTRHVGWGRLLDGGRLVPAFAVVAVASLVLGLIVARFIQPPGAASSAHSVTAGFITAPVVRTTLRSNVVTRADASFADAVKIMSPPGISGTAIVTGSLPPVGDEVAALSVVAEVSGRPIILLPGSIPAYRTLSFGVSGTDVLQLKRALASVGINPGNAASDLYDASTAAAVAALYQRVGYTPATGDAGSEDQVQSARAGVTAAQDSVDAATLALSKAQNALSPQGQLEQNNLVASAQRAEQSAQRALTAANATLVTADSALAQAQAANAAAQQALASTPGNQSAQANAAAAEAALNVATASRESDADAAADASDALANAHDATALAIADRAAALASPDTSDQAAAVVSARHGLSSAEAELTSATDDSLPILPLGEIAFVTQLPRRVDSVTATVGSPASGALLSLSGANLALVASVSPSDAALLKVGDKATFNPAEGGPPIDAEVTALDVSASTGATTSTDSGGTAETSGANGSASTASQSRMSVTLAPEGLTAAQIKTLNGSNVRVTIPVGATAGNVLAVPIAAVSLGPGGTSRVEVVGHGAKVSFVGVTTGLVASGDVQVSSASGALRVGDKVVVGR